jgi:hypothetical protein
MDLKNVHFEQDGEELKIYIGGFFLTSVNTKDVSKEARAELPDFKTKDGKHVSALLLSVLLLSALLLLSILSYGIMIYLSV